MRPHIFRQHRRAMKLTQDELGTKLGISARSIKRYEAGRIEIPQRTIIALEALVKDAGL
jgi:transcriptional regulator with XRE-family HTH domain